MGLGTPGGDAHAMVNVGAGFFIGQWIDMVADRHPLSDLSERMVASASETAASTGLENCRFEHMDAAELELGEASFGHPVRITATTRLGSGDVVDIEREVKLGGAIHSKGVMILSAALSARYAPEVPLSLQGSIVFEQSYGGVDGDSASVAELCALLSSLSRVPVRQCIACTGSINQLGRIQAVGGCQYSVSHRILGIYLDGLLRQLFGQLTAFYIQSHDVIIGFQQR
mgnify:CR=1 FL=1